jgi:protein-S-isoprenylcysteine O-methyltransferase Ste14
MAWTLVATQMLLLLALVGFPGRRVWPTPAWLVVLAALLLAVALAVLAAGALRLGAGLTASPLPAPAAQLRTTGVYGCVRHPIYSALLLGGAGLVLLGGRPARAGALLALLALLYVKMAVEEPALGARFPGYRDYARRTPRLVPHPARCLSRLLAGRSAPR